MRYNLVRKNVQSFSKQVCMLIYDDKLRTNQAQQQAIDEAIRTAQFIRNKCLRKWMDERGIGDNDLQVYCSQLATDFPFAALLNSQAHQTSADRAWLSIARFYKNCREQKPGKKGYPRFQHDNRSVEYKATGWKLEPDGKRITFTDGMGIGTMRLIGKKRKLKPIPSSRSSGSGWSNAPMAIMCSLRSGTPVLKHGACRG